MTARVDIYERVRACLRKLMAAGYTQRAIVDVLASREPPVKVAQSTLSRFTDGGQDTVELDVGLAILELAANQASINEGKRAQQS